MTTRDPMDDILDFAISEEEKAAAFYNDMAARMERLQMRDVFLGFAREEVEHKRRLLEVKSGKRPARTAGARALDLKISEYTVDVDVAPNMSLQDALIVAMKKEKAAFRLYSDLAREADDPNVRGMFLYLAQEEARHKLRFEVEYDELVMSEN